MSEPGGADITEENKDSELVAAVPIPVAPDSTLVAPATITTITEPVPVAAPTNVVEPIPAAVAQAPNTVAPVSNVVARVSTIVPSLVATSSDVIAAVEDMLTSTAGPIHAFTPTQADLYSLLGIARVGPLSAGVGGHDGIGQSVAADASVPLAPPTALQSPMVPPQTGVPGVTWDSNPTGIAPLGGIATTPLGQQLPLTGQQRPARDAIIPMGVGEFVRQAFDELRRSPALAALVAAALPGLGGLLVVTGAGMRLGYRQAKAELALRTAGVTPFARSGPIGVVRSGSMVYVRPRTLHVVRPGTVGARPILDEAA